MAERVHPMHDPMEDDTEVTVLGPGARADENVADGDNDIEQKPNGEDNDSGEADDALCPKEGCSCGDAATQVGTTLLLCIIIVPITVMLLVILPASGVLMIYEDWDFVTSFKFLMQIVSGLTNPITNAQPNWLHSELTVTVITVSALCISGAIIGIGGDLNWVQGLVEFMEKLGYRVACRKSKKVGSLIGLFLFAIIVVPALCMLVSLFSALVLAAIENGLHEECSDYSMLDKVSNKTAECWSLRVSLLYISSSIAGLANPLTDKSPEHTEGQVFAIVVSLWVLTIAGIIIGAVSNFGVLEVVTEFMNNPKEACRREETETADE